MSLQRHCTGYELLTTGLVMYNRMPYRWIAYPMELNEINICIYKIRITLMEDGEHCFWR